MRQEAAAQVLIAWNSDPALYSESLPKQGYRARKIIKIAFEILAAIQDSRGLAAVPRAMEQEPQFMPTLAKYLLSLAEAANKPTMSTIEDCLKRLALTNWQKIWLLQVLENEHFLIMYPQEILSFVRACLDDPLEPVRSHAVWTLASHSTIKIEEWRRVASRATLYGEPYVEAAIQGLYGVDRSDLLASDSLLGGCIRKAAATWIGPPF